MGAIRGTRRLAGALSLAARQRCSPTPWGGDGPGRPHEALRWEKVLVELKVLTRRSLKEACRGKREWPSPPPHGGEGKGGHDGSCRREQRLVVV